LKMPVFRCGKELGRVLKNRYFVGTTQVEIPPYPQFHVLRRLWITRFTLCYHLLLLLAVSCPNASALSLAEEKAGFDVDSTQVDTHGSKSRMSDVVLNTYSPYLSSRETETKGLVLEDDLSGTIKVLVLGDSMSLCGFGERLDRDFRRNPRIKSIYTYMAGGTNPLSWLKEKPYSTIKTYCGYESIESVEGTIKPDEVIVDDGKPYPVPKVEDLMAKIEPDVLVIQSGNNLYDLFRDGKTVNPKCNGPVLDVYIAHFLSRAIENSSRLRKIYWVTPPTTGRISQEIQDFLVQEIGARAAGVVTVIDSRLLMSYPYKRMQKDLTHFVGSEMTEWADKVYGIIEQDLAAKPLASLAVLTALPPVAAKEPNKTEEKTVAGAIDVEAQLIFKSKPMPVKELLPYKESLVAFVYKVNKVVDGNYASEKIVVMHPAHIGLKEQDLSKSVIGKSYAMQLRLLTNTVWEAVKCRDESEEIDLIPYIQVEDEKKFPTNIR